MRDDLFARARAITALEAANRERLPLQRGGGRWPYKMCCPLHGEKTPSLMFDTRGGWFCFGCNRGGSDGASFLAALRGCSQYAAAMELAGGEPTAPVDPTIKAQRERERAGLALLKAVEDWRKSFDSLLSVTLRALNDFIQGERADDDLLWGIVRLCADLQHELDYLDAVQDTPNLLFGLYKEYNS